MIKVDIIGHPPIPFVLPLLVLSFFQFQQNLLFLAVFWVLNFQSHFGALMTFFGKTGRNMGLWIDFSHSKFAFLG